MKNVLFICTGNVCRSPMAEQLFRSHMNGDRDIEVGSAGIGAMEGHGPSSYAIEVMQEKGLDISKLRSQPVQEDLVERADCIFVMTYGHLDTLLLLYPNAAKKTFMLREFQPGLALEQREVDDPIGQSRETYRACRDQIEESIPSLLEVVRHGYEKGAVARGGAMAIGLAGDATGRILLTEAAEVLREEGCMAVMLAAGGKEEFPELAKVTAEAITSGRLVGAVLVGRSGVGLCMGANRYASVRAVVANSPETARLARERYQANVLCLGAEDLGAAEARACVQAWISACGNGARLEGAVGRLETLGGGGIRSAPI